MQKVVCMISGNEVVEQAVQAILEDFKTTNEKLAFLKKQANDLMEKATKERVPYFEAIAEQVKSKLPDDFNLEKYHFHIDEEQDVVALCDGDHDEHPMEKLLRQMGAVPIKPS